MKQPKASPNILQMTLYLRDLLHIKGTSKKYTYFRGRRVTKFRQAIYYLVITVTNPFFWVPFRPDMRHIHPKSNFPFFLGETHIDDFQ